MNLSSTILSKVFLIIGMVAFITTTGDDGTVLQVQGHSPLFSPTLHSLFESVNEEHTAHRMTVEGVVPSWIKGAKYNNGFGKFEAKSGEWRFNMLFEASAVVYRWRIDNGQVYFTNKFVRSEYFNDTMRNRVPRAKTFLGTTPPMSVWDRLYTILTNSVGDNYVVNAVPFSSRERDHLFAISDIAGHYEVDFETLDTIGPYHFDDSISGQFYTLTCAHPTVVAGVPGWFNYNLNMNFFYNMYKNGWSLPFEYHIWKTDPSAAEPMRRTILAKIPTGWRIPYVHSFPVTRNFAIITEFPLFWKIGGVAFSVLMEDALYYDPSQQVKSTVVDLRTGEVVAVFESIPTAFFSFHFINAYEDEATRSIVVDWAGFHDIKYHLRAYVVADDRKANEFPLDQGVTYRLVYRLPETSCSSSGATLAAGGSISQSIIGGSNVDVELPIINNNFRGRDYQYFYATGKTVHQSWWNEVVKVNVKTGKVLTWSKPDHWPSEPSFVQRQRSGVVDLQSEDDGVLLVNVLGPDSSYLLILDARDFSVLATAKAPMKIAYTSHGNWVDDDDRSEKTSHSTVATGPSFREEL